MNERDAARLLENMTDAINNHDLDRLISCFHTDYRSVQPAHPERSFTGQQRVAGNWTWVFKQYADFQAVVVDFAFRDCTVWSEWVWRGTDPDDVEVEVRGVMILTVEEQRIRSGRLYMEPVR